MGSDTDITTDTAALQHLLFHHILTFNLNETMVRGH